MKDIKLTLFNDNECPICYEDLVNYVKLECNHNFCLECHSDFIINKYTKCPICRNNIKGMQKHIVCYERINLTNDFLMKENTSLEIKNKVIIFKYQELRYRHGKLLMILVFILAGLIYFFTSWAQTKTDKILFEKTNPKRR